MSDIEGTSRPISTSMGCYEIPLLNLNGALANISGLRQGGVFGQNDTVKVDVINTGITTITSMNLGWSVNGTPMTPSNHTPISLASGGTITLNVGVINYTTVGNVDVCVWINSANGVPDNYRDDDTTCTSTYICTSPYSGPITVGPSLGNDFNTIDQAIQEIIRCGVSGNITLSLESGTYNSNLNLTNSATLFGNYHLTITSQANHRDSVIIRPASGVVITLNNTNNLTLEAITIDASLGTATAYGVQFTGDASNIVINNCAILANPTATATTLAPIYKTTSTGGLVGLTVKNCDLIGGYYGVYLNGATTLKYKNVTIENNTITRQCNTGVYHNCVDSSIISSNYIASRTANQLTTWTGIYSYYDIGGRIENNRIYSNNTGITGTLRGMQPYYADSSTVIANNEIILLSAGTPTAGIYIDYPRNLHLYHNSIYVNKSGTTGDNRAFFSYINNTTERLTLKNNIFIAEGGAVGTIYAIYLSTTAANVVNTVVDYNNYYSNGTNLGYMGVARVDLVDWKANLPQDVNSVNVFPTFVNLANSLALTASATNDSLSCPMVLPVTTDIEGNIRRPGAATMGAYERPPEDLI